VGLSGGFHARFPFASIDGLPDVLGFHGHLIPSGQNEVQMKNRLRVLRAERGWSQADLAQRLEVSRQSVNAIETGKFDPSLPLAFRLARLFGTTIETIFTDEEQVERSLPSPEAAAR
jgi:putative transcriptional regulator